MYTDLFLALLDKKNARGHPLLAALLYAFCPAAARWWVNGADPTPPFDPLWQALVDRTTGKTLKEALSAYGFENLLDEAQEYVRLVDTQRREHPGVASPERLFPQPAVEGAKRFGLREAVARLGGDWDNFFAYIHAWVFVYVDWEYRMRFNTLPQFQAVRLALSLPGFSRVVYFPAWQWVAQHERTTRTVLGLLVNAGNKSSQLRLALARLAQPAADDKWPSTPEVWALDCISGLTDHVDILVPGEELPQAVKWLAQLAKAGPYPPLPALQDPAQCKTCGFHALCFTQTGEISPLTLRERPALRDKA